MLQHPNLQSIRITRSDSLVGGLAYGRSPHRAELIARRIKIRPGDSIRLDYAPSGRHQLWEYDPGLVWRLKSDGKDQSLPLTGASQDIAVNGSSDLRMWTPKVLYDGVKAVAEEVVSSSMDDVITLVGSADGVLAPGEYSVRPETIVLVDSSTTDPLPQAGDRYLLHPADGVNWAEWRDAGGLLHTDNAGPTAINGSFAGATNSPMVLIRNYTVDRYDARLSESVVSA